MEFKSRKDFFYGPTLLVFSTRKLQSLDPEPCDTAIYEQISPVNFDRKVAASLKALCTWMRRQHH